MTYCPTRAALSEESPVNTVHTSTGILTFLGEQTTNHLPYMGLGYWYIIHTEHVDTGDSLCENLSSILQESRAEWRGRRPLERLTHWVLSRPATTAEELSVMWHNRLETSWNSSSLSANFPEIRLSDFRLSVFDISNCFQFSFYSLLWLHEVLNIFKFYNR